MIDGWLHISCLGMDCPGPQINIRSISKKSVGQINFFTSAFLTLDKQKQWIWILSQINFTCVCLHRVGCWESCYHRGWGQRHIYWRYSCLSCRACSGFMGSASRLEYITATRQAGWQPAGRLVMIIGSVTGGECHRGPPQLHTAPTGDTQYHSTQQILEGFQIKSNFERNKFFCWLRIRSRKKADQF